MAGQDLAAVLSMMVSMVMEKLHEGLEDKSFFERPEGITSVNVCADCGLKATELCTQD